jgi:hypothetical protein
MKRCARYLAVADSLANGCSLSPTAQSLQRTNIFHSLVGSHPGLPLIDPIVPLLPRLVGLVQYQILSSRQRKEHKVILVIYFTLRGEELILLAKES